MIVEPALQYLVVTKWLLTSKPCRGTLGVPTVKLEPAYVVKGGQREPAQHEAMASPISKQGRPSKILSNEVPQFRSRVSFAPFWMA